MASDSCIDDIYVQGRVEDGVVKDIRFDGIACTIATASTSIMSELVSGKSVAQAREILRNYLAMIDQQEYDEELLQEAVAFANVGRQATASNVRRSAGRHWKKYWMKVKGKTMKNDQLQLQDTYAYGFHDEDVSVYKTQAGLSREVVETISDIKKEPQWMKELRLKAYDSFMEQKNPSWGPDLSGIQFDEYTYYIKPSEKQGKNWDEVPDTIKNTFDRLGIPQAEAKYLAGVSTQYESEVVYHNMLEEVEAKGVIFLDTDTALREHPDLVRKYFGTLVPYTDNKYAALKYGRRSGGSFIYVPKGVKLEKPLQSYFRINSQLMGQFERTLIIVDEGAVSIMSRAVRHRSIPRIHCMRPLWRSLCTKMPAAVIPPCRTGPTTSSTW